MNNHGWWGIGQGDGTVLFNDGSKITGAQFRIAVLVEERHRCACPVDTCQRRATAEDLLCDECRAECG